MPQIAGRWNIFENRVIMLCVLAWFVAQIIKLVLNLVQNRHLDWELLVTSGGMPSSHCSTVAALATAVGISDGLDSILFAISGVLALIVIYDAAGVRRTVGIQSTILNRMLDELFRGNPLWKDRLRELIGHTRLEVIAGVFLGIFIGWTGMVVGR